LAAGRSELSRAPACADLRGRRPHQRGAGCRRSWGASGVAGGRFPVPDHARRLGV